MTLRRTLLIVLCTFAPGLLGGAVISADSKTVGPFCDAGEAYLLRADQTEHGDRYLVAARGITVDGAHDGDMLCLSRKVSISGEVLGDLFAGADAISISGTIRDSTRLFGQDVDISGTIEGDLLVVANTLNILTDAHITGRVIGAVAHFTQLGTIDGDVQVTGGETTLAGSIGGNARIKADTITFEDSARVGGDLTYSARNSLPENVAEFVGGEIVHNEIQQDGEEDTPNERSPREIFMSIVKWFYWPVAAFVVGAILMGLTGKFKHEAVQRFEKEGWIGLAIGVFALPVLAVASVVAILLVLTIPLGLTGLFLVAFFAYVGKIPTAIWLGSRLLALRGGTRPSIYLALAVGLLISYLAFSIPFFIGTLLYWGSTAAGIGAVILAIRTTREQSVAEA